MADTAAQALTGKLNEIILGGEPLGSRAFVSLVGGGYPLDASDVEWAKATPPYTGTKDADRAAEFATAVNRIPNAVGNWTASQQNMDESFRKTWLDNAKFNGIDLSPEEKEELAAAKTFREENLEKYLDKRGEWNNANDRLQAALVADRNDPQYLTNLRHARNDLQDAQDAWEVIGKKSEVEKADVIYDMYSRTGFLGAAKDLRDRYDKWRNENRTTTDAPFVPVRLFPNDFLDPAPAQSWSKFSFSSNEVTKYTENKETKVNAGINLNALFWTASADVSYEESQQYSDTDTSDITVAFEFTRVQLDRSAWFDSFLLKSSAWWWDGATKAEPTKGGVTFSDGGAPPTTAGQWQMVPSEMIVARNLKVTTNNADLQSSDWAKKFDVGVKGGFWIFTTEDRVQGEESRNYTHNFTSNSTLEAAQPQIIAFVCELMPKEPNPDPNLLPG